MESLYIQGSQHTPEVVFGEDGILLIKGRSIPENSLAFFQDLYNWLDVYAAKPHSVTEIGFQLDYFNTSSSKCILDVLKRLEKIHLTGDCKVYVKWYYDEEDDDMLESGEDYQDLIDLSFDFIVLEE